MLEEITGRTGNILYKGYMDVSYTNYGLKHWVMFHSKTAGRQI